MKLTGISERKTLKEMMDIYPDTFALVIDPKGDDGAQDLSSFSGIFHAVTDGPKSESKMYDLWRSLRKNGSNASVDVEIPGPVFYKIYGDDWQKNWKRY